jgi:hypothetical protein
VQHCAGHVGYGPPRSCCVSSSQHITCAGRGAPIRAGACTVDSRRGLASASAFGSETAVPSVKLDDAVCEGFRMPAADEPCRALWRPASESLQGRKPRLGKCGGAAGFDLLRLDGCRRDPPAQLFRYGTNVANGRKQLSHPVYFQRVTCGKNSTYFNFCVMSLIETFVPHRLTRFPKLPTLSNGNCFQCALYIARDHRCISDHTRFASRYRCRLSASSAIDRVTAFSKFAVFGHVHLVSSSGNTLYRDPPCPWRPPQCSTARAV